MVEDRNGGRIDAYLALMEERPDLFPMADGIIVDRDALEEYAASSGKEIGIVYESPWHYLLVDVVKGEDGKPAYAYERYVSRTDQPGGVVLPVTCDGEIFMLENYRHTRGRVVLELPRGGGLDGEDGREAALRELSEETGMDIRGSRVLGHVVADSGISGDAVTIVEAEVAEPSAKIGHEGIRGYVLLSPAEVDAMISDGTIDDGFSLAAIAMMRAAGNGEG